MELLIGSRATSFPAMSVASLGSNSVIIQVRIFDPTPAAGLSMSYSGFMQPDGTLAPGPAVASGIILSLTYVPGKQRTQSTAKIASSAPLPLRQLSRQVTMALVPSAPGPIANRRVSLRQIESASRSTSMTKKSQPAPGLWFWLAAWLVPASILVYCAGLYQNM
ncbi:hypothetical protein DXG01_012087 [Tephrocybe rancida]|nr:hypothetical protein DXG01_012087 [Tephrocybe rancida]